MKTKIIIINFIVCLLFKANGQIILEYSYDSASTYITPRSELFFIKFENSGERIVKINRLGKSINIFDINHTLLKSISYATLPQSVSDMPTFLYLSENLFNTDNKLEFMYIFTQGALYFVKTHIYNEDGILIFQADSLAPLVVSSTPLYQFPIFNTEQGTKMILSHQSNGQAKVFSLPGTLSASIDQANHQLMQIQNGQFGNLYPNPSPGAVTIEYELPKGEAEGEIVLYNMAGLEVKRYGVDNTFKDIYLDNSMLPAGTYLWQLQTAKGAVGSKKMIIIK